jgi:hypothetical protein
MMSALAGVMLLGFLFVIASALLVWVLLQPRPKAERAPRRRPTVPELPKPERRERALSNDDVRGAKRVEGIKRPALPDDAFERFLRAGREEDRD